MLSGMLRSSTRVLRKLCGLEPAAAAAARRLSAAEASATSPSASARDNSLLRPLPGLDLPPPLPDNLGRSPTRITTLPCGIRVATEDVPGPSACIGFFINSGSIYESGETIGVSYMLEKMAFKDTKHRRHRNLVHELELAGGNVGASCAREQMVYSYDTLKGYMPEAIEILIDCMRNPLFLQEEVERQLVLAREEVQNLQKNPERFLHEQLNLVGFSGAIANPLIPPEDALARINGKTIQKFYHENYTADRVVLAASGVDHERLLNYSEFLLHDWHTGSPVEKTKSTYVGGDSRHRADSDTTHVALAFEVPGGWLQERDATIMTVIQTLMGGGGSFSSGGPGKGMHSRLYLRVLNKYHAVQSFSAFSNENYTADRVVLAASGVDHERLLNYSEFLLHDWHTGSPVEKTKSTYVGGDSRHRADSDTTHVALAFEVPGGWLQERDATIMTVIQTLMGGGGSFSSGGPGKGMHSRLYLRVLNKYHAVQSFSAFSNVYDNTGLFGIYMTTSSDFVAKAVDVATSELIAVATPGEVTEVELQRAKNSTISSVLMNLESRVIVAEDIGRQLLTYGCRKPIDYFLQCMEEITLNDITTFARKMLSSQPTMVSWGDVGKVPPYEFVCKRFH